MSQREGKEGAASRHLVASFGPFWVKLGPGADGRCGIIEVRPNGETVAICRRLPGDAPQVGDRRWSEAPEDLMALAQAMLMRLRSDPAQPWPRRAVQAVARLLSEVWSPGFAVAAGAIRTTAERAAASHRREQEHADPPGGEAGGA